MDKPTNSPLKTGDVTPQNQNDLSTAAVTARFMNDVSKTFRSGADNFSSDVDAHNILTDLQTDPLKKPILENIANEMNDKKLMSSLGLTGSVERDQKGDITNLVFNSQSQTDLYNKQLLQIEANGVTPTQADAEIRNENMFSIDRYTGTLNFDVNDPVRFFSIG